eukprot:3755216-Amphidinium_carterae.2
MWLPIATKAFATPHMVCLHTDSATAYNEPLPEVSGSDPYIIRQKTKVDIGGGRTTAVKAGTQTIDGFWSHLRTHITGNPSKMSESLGSMIRMAQYKYWACGRDSLAMLADTLK